MQPTTRLEKHYAVEPKIEQIGLHTVIEGSFTTVPPTEKVDVFFFDTPSVEATESDIDYAFWVDAQLKAVEKWRKRDAALFLAPTDRKGHPWSKSAVTVNVAFAHLWGLYRHFVWLKQEADFHRSQYAFQDVWALRKGNIASQKDSDVRYKDVVRFVQRHDVDSHVGELSVEMIEHFLPLFATGDAVVMDPFAGRGTVMQACQRLGLRSISVELHPERAEDLRKLAVALSEGTK